MTGDVLDQGRCESCWRQLKHGAAFCGGCGAPRPSAVIVLPPPGGGDVKMVMVFFVLTLAAAAGWMIYARITEATFTTVVGGSLTLAALTLVFAFKYRPLLAGATGKIGFGPLGYLLIVIASVPIVLIVAGYVDALHAWFGIQVPGELAEFDGRHAMWAIAIIVILPPLAEELAFRGLIYGGLRKSFTVGEAMIVSSFAFAILHLSVPSLVTHFPLGLYFCWLRHRSGSLWPGVFAHACHNFGVTLLEWM